MGGYGSGRKLSAKDTTENHLRLDIRTLQRQKLLRTGGNFVWTWLCNDLKVASVGVFIYDKEVILEYWRGTRNANRQSVRECVRLSRTDCYLGGQRAWFSCPVPDCGRRVAILYGPADGFVCRHCRQLAYESQRETAHDRLARRANRIRAKLGWTQGILNSRVPVKPTGMHWKTFYRLKAKHDRLVQAALTGIMKEMNLAEPDQFS